MNTKTLFLALVAVTLAVAPRAARSQDVGDAMLNRMVAWFTGDQAVVENGIQPYDGPKYYAEDTCCADGCCGCCSNCCKQFDTWGSVEFLMWWGKGSPLPPLVTTSTPGTVQANAGVLGLGSTSTLFGSELAANKLQGGGRVTAGIWLDPEHNVAAGGRFFGLGGDTTRFNQSSTGNPILARPFYNALLGQDDALIVAFPGFAQGSINAHAITNNVIGAEAFTEIMMGRDSRRRIDLVAGYQFFRLDDALQVDSQSTITQIGNPLIGTRLDVTDRFVAHNQFHGGELGMRARMARGQWSLNLLGQVGIGNMNEQVTISGATSVTAAGGGGTISSSGGLLTKPSNIGTYERNRFAFLPQITGNLNYHFTPNLSVHVGYNILWISDVALAGDQVSLTVNQAQPVGPNAPAFVFHDRDYWLQGFNWGMNWDF